MTFKTAYNGVDKTAPKLDMTSCFKQAICNIIPDLIRIIGLTILEIPENKVL